jgi:hypothetical protein
LPIADWNTCGAPLFVSYGPAKLTLLLVKIAQAETIADFQHCRLPIANCRFEFLPNLAVRVLPA